MEWRSKFLIDTGCQVTILATSVFERMCASDPRVHSRLRPCSRWLVLADSLPLTVRGELDMTVIFPGLSCEMLLMVASSALPGEVCGTMPDHLEDIVAGSTTPWGRPVGCCSGTSSVGTHMFSRRLGNL